MFYYSILSSLLLLLIILFASSSCAAPVNRKSKNSLSNLLKSRSSASSSFPSSINKISAILNQDAFLPCETRQSMLIDLGDQLSKLTNNPNNQKHSFSENVANQINLIHWYRNGQTIPFYTIDARPKPTPPETSSPAPSMLDDYYYDDDYGNEKKNVQPNSATNNSNGNSNENESVRHQKIDPRMDFDLSQTTPLLRIKNVTEFDDGLYQCRVEYAGQRTFITELRLSVIGEPVSLQITDSEGNQLKDVIGPYNEFESITLICNAYGGRPKPSVIWFKQHGFYEELIDDSFHSVPSGRESSTSSTHGTMSTVSNVLNLNRLDRDDYQARYLCRASTRFYYPPLTQIITIDMNLMPVNVRLYTDLYHTSPQQVPLIAGKIVEFGCRTDGSKPAAQIDWFLDNQRIVFSHENDHNGEQNDHNSGNDQDQPAYYGSNVRHLSTTTTANHNNINLNLPQIELEIGSQSSDIVTADSGSKPKSVLVLEQSPLLELNCHVNANPWIDQVTWFLDDKPITKAQSLRAPFDQSSSVRLTEPNTSDNDQSKLTNNDHRLLAPLFILANNNQTLRIESIDHRKHVGQYRCQARNSIDTGQSESIQVNVAYKPECFHNRDVQSIEIVRNREAEPVVCLIDANPSEVGSIRFYWTLHHPASIKDLKINVEQFSQIQQTNESTTVTGSLLDVNRAIEYFFDSLTTTNNLEISEEQDNKQFWPNSISTLVLECKSENIAGRQKEPCPFMLKILDGPPQRVQKCWHNQQSQIETNSGSINKTVVVRCVVGNAGGATSGINSGIQTVTMLAIVSNRIPWNDTQNNENSMTDSILNLINNILSKNYFYSTGTDNNNITIVRWNISATVVMNNNESSRGIMQRDSVAMVEFILDKNNSLWNDENSSFNVAGFDASSSQLNSNQSYDLLIYSQNLIGLSMPLIYTDFITIPNFDLKANKDYVSNQSVWILSTSTIQRIKGLTLSLLLLFFIGFLVYFIKSCYFTSTLYDSVTLRQQRRLRRHRQQQQNFKNVPNSNNNNNDNNNGNSQTNRTSIHLNQNSYHSPTDEIGNFRLNENEEESENDEFVTPEPQQAQQIEFYEESDDINVDDNSFDDVSGSGDVVVERFNGQSIQSKNGHRNNLDLDRAGTSSFTPLLPERKQKLRLTATQASSSTLAAGICPNHHRLKCNYTDCQKAMEPETIADKVDWCADIASCSNNNKMTVSSMYESKEPLNQNHIWNRNWLAKSIDIRKNLKKTTLEPMSIDGQLLASQLADDQQHCTTTTNILRRHHKQPKKMKHFQESSSSTRMLHKKRNLI